MKALANGYREAIAKGGDFAIPTPSGGRWIGSVTAIARRAEPVLAARTFVNG
jgi:hypothetical protein